MGHWLNVPYTLCYLDILLNLWKLDWFWYMSPDCWYSNPVPSDCQPSMLSVSAIQERINFLMSELFWLGFFIRGDMFQQGLLSSHSQVFWIGWVLPDIYLLPVCSLGCSACWLDWVFYHSHYKRIMQHDTMIIGGRYLFVGEDPKQKSFRPKHVINDGIINSHLQGWWYDKQIIRGPGTIPWGMPESIIALENYPSATGK